MEKKRIKIGVIGVKGLPGYGGAARSCGEIFSRVKNDFDITVYALNSHVSEHSEHEVEGIEQVVFRSSILGKYADVIYYLKSVFHALLFRNFDVIHLNHHITGFLVPLLRIRYRVLFVIHGMAYERDDKWNTFDKWLIGSFYKIGCRFASLVTTVEKRSVSRLQPYSNNEVHFIPNGVNRYFEKSKRHNDPSFDITFSAARIIYLKGLHILLEALHLIGYRGKVQVIGDLDHVPDYKRKTLQMTDGLNIVFQGLIPSQNQLFESLNNGRIYVFPSYSEGMSNMLLEVAALKIPVIASDITQNKDVFSDSEVLFFSAGDAKDLAEKIVWAEHNYQMMQEKSEAAYRKVTSAHDWDAIAEKYAALYEQIGS